MIVSYRYRLLPRRQQHRALERILESQRQLYNAALEERMGAWRRAGLTLTYFDQCKSLTIWRHSDPEGAALPPNLQRATLKRVDEAYAAFFRRVKEGTKPGHPRFRGKGRFNTFGFNEFAGVTLRGGSLRFKGVPGRLRVHWHRELEPGASIRRCTFSRDTKGWTVTFALRVDAAPPRPENRVVGVDLGIRMLAVLSDGGFIPSIRAARRCERRLRILQRALARKKRGSGGRLKARSQLARCHAAITRKRNDHLHQASARLVRDYDVIVMENLNVKGLARSALAKDFHDASWARFIAMVRYKAEWAGARLIEVDSHGTSQECSRCGVKVSKALSDRHHNCVDCGLFVDRDLNAARNILKRAGVGPGLPNVADCGMRASENLGLAYLSLRQTESLPYTPARPRPP